jgi:dihydrofolate reductase
VADPAPASKGILWNGQVHAEGKNIRIVGGGEIIASFLDAGAIDEFFISVVPVFIGEGIPLIAPRHRDAVASGYVGI